MEPQEIQRVRGTNDATPPESAELDRIQRAMRGYFELYGYRPIDTPIIEDLDLFLRKSGEEIVARMYTFTHWNRQLCLRPELTASVLRAYTNHLQDRPLPVRLHYAGPAFRYEKPQRGRYRQFTQVGLECIGGEGAAADAEILAAALGSIATLGLTDARIVIGHLGAVLQMLRQLGIDEHGQSLILASLEHLGRRRAEREDVVSRILTLMGLNRADDVDDPEPSLLPSLLAQFGPSGATNVAADLLARANLTLESGTRTPEEVVERLLAKAGRPDATTQVHRAIDFIVELADAAGSPPEGIDRLDALLARHGLDAAPLREVERAIALLGSYQVGNPEISIDLSLGRGLRYYTGMVFEIHHGPAGPSSQICGGGRYDDLVRALGGRENVPACGFSFGLERVRMALQAAHATDEGARPSDAIVAPIESADEAESIALSQRLRAAGLAVELDVRLRGVRANLRNADRANVPVLVICGQQELRQGQVIVRDMRGREEKAVSLADVPRVVKEILA
ncbi:MAG: HisS family protein [Chloroflexota bacterium]